MEIEPYMRDISSTYFEQAGVSDKVKRPLATITFIVSSVQPDRS